MAVVARSLAYPRPSMLSSMAVPLQEEDLPLQDRLEQPLPDALPTSLRHQNWQALQRRAAVCLRGQRYAFPFHGLGILQARACACRCPSTLWLGSQGRASLGSHDEGTDSRPRFDCDLVHRLLGCADKLGTRCQLERGTHCNKRPRKENSR